MACIGLVHVEEIFLGTHSKIIIIMFVHLLDLSFYHTCKNYYVSTRARIITLALVLETESRILTLALVLELLCKYAC